MDPNTALRELRETSSRLTELLGDPMADPDTIAVLADRMSTLFDGLDAWLQGGGFLPSAWRGRGVLPDDALPDATERALQRGLGPMTDWLFKTQMRDPLDLRTASEPVPEQRGQLGVKIVRGGVAFTAMPARDTFPADAVISHAEAVTLAHALLDAFEVDGNG